MDGPREATHAASLRRNLQQMSRHDLAFRRSRIVETCYVQSRTMRHEERIPFQRRHLPAGIGTALRGRRVERGLSRRDVAGSAGIAARTLARIERDAQAPTWKTLEAVCDALEISTSVVAPRWSRDASDLPEDAQLVPGLGLRALRRKRGMTLASLAKASGVSAATISRFERGLVVSRRLAKRPVHDGVIDYDTLLIDNDRLAEALGLGNSAALREACLGASAADDATPPIGRTR